MPYTLTPSNRVNRYASRLLLGVLLLILPDPVLAGNQTETLSPVVVGGNLPYRVELTLHDFGAASFPTLQSYARATYDNKWILLAGRTNGMHSLTSGGIGAFPPASQNREVWVIDPATRQTWHRSLEDVSSGLSTSAVDMLARTNTQFTQQDNHLYVTGGYGFDRSANRFGTSDALTSIDIPSLMDWVQTGAGSAAASMRQIHDPIFKVTGGEMHRIGSTTHLVFGQDFDGPYAGGAIDGQYTKQVRSFEILDNGVTLSIQNAHRTNPDDAYRRRDLNVAPMLHRNESTGDLEESLTALSGAFTPPPGFGIWTVPVEIDAMGNPTMADPLAEETFKQGMNSYHSAKLGLFSEADNAMHTVLFGGISYQFYDAASDTFMEDAQLPFINQITSLVRDADGNYTQYLLNTEFPEVLNIDNGQRWRFGTNAEFFVAPGVATLGHDILSLDSLTQPTTVGYIVGGLASDDGNFGNTVASNLVFRVSVVPIPEPASMSFLVIGMLLLSHRRCSLRRTVPL